MAHLLKSVRRRRRGDDRLAGHRDYIGAWLLHSHIGEALIEVTRALEGNLGGTIVPASVKDRVTSWPPRDEDPRVAAALADWRKALRDSLPRWAPKD